MRTQVLVIERGGIELTQNSEIQAKKDSKKNFDLFTQRINATCAPRETLALVLLACKPHFDQVDQAHEKT